MQLSPLQSRLAASVIASCLLLVIYFLLLSPQFALAAELDRISTDLDAAELAYERQDDVEAEEVLDFRSPSYEPDFGLFDRGIIGRAADGAATMQNNEIKKSNLAPGVMISYVFPASSLSGRTEQDSNESVELRRSLNGSEEANVDESEDEGINPDPELERRQQATKTLWISANTCDQPWRKPDQTTMDPPQLTLYVSTSADNTSPGPLASPDTQKIKVFTEGAVMFNISTSQDVYMSVAAPNVSTEFFDTTKEYNFELVASTDQYYYSYNEKINDELIWVDSDASAALLQSGYLTNHSDQEVMKTPYVMFAHNQDNLVINGIRNSYCGLGLYAQMRNLDDGSSGQILTGLKMGGDKNLTRQEFYVSGLNASSNYIGILARPPTKSTTQKRQDDLSSTVGGGIVFRPTTFQTKPGKYIMNFPQQ